MSANLGCFCTPHFLCSLCHLFNCILHFLLLLPHMSTSFFSLSHSALSTLKPPLSQVLFYHGLLCCFYGLLCCFGFDSVVFLLQISLCPLPSPVSIHFLLYPLYISPPLVFYDLLTIYWCVCERGGGVAGG